MGRIAFRWDDVEKYCDIQRDSSLADVQQLLCRLYRQSFPAKKAVLTLEGNKYDVFVRSPFKHSNDGVTVEVEFVDTDDPFFYDKVDRGLKITLAEEVAHDDAVAAGMTINCIEAWVWARRAVELRTA